MLIYRLTFFLFLLTFSPLLEAEVVKEIHIFGNKTTKDAVILKSIKHRIKDQFKTSDAELIERDLLDLDLFNDVQVTSKEADNSLVLLVVLEEKAPIHLDPFWDTDELYGNIYGGSLNFHNLWGMNQDLKLTGFIGGAKDISFVYQDNYFLGINTKWGGKTSKTWFNNPFLNFQEERLQGGVFIKRKILPKLDLCLDSGYENIAIDPKDKSLTLTGKDELWNFSSQLFYDQRDLVVFPSSSFYLVTSLETKWNKDLQRIFTRPKIELAFFYPLFAPKVLALYTEVIISYGKVPLYERIYLGGSKTLRGYPRGAFSGEDMVMASLEYRIPMSVTVDKEGPAVFAFYLFSDWGWAGEEIKEFKWKGFASSAGLGVFWMFLNKVQLRLDLGIARTGKIGLTTTWGWRF